MSEFPECLLIVTAEVDAASRANGIGGTTRFTAGRAECGSAARPAYVSSGGVGNYSRQSGTDSGAVTRRSRPTTRTPSLPGVPRHARLTSSPTRPLAHAGHHTGQARSVSSAAPLTAHWGVATLLDLCSSSVSSLRRKSAMTAPELTGHVHAV
jgi:hypothetical protein